MNISRKWQEKQEVINVETTNLNWFLYAIGYYHWKWKHIKIQHERKNK